jgi:uroporphyrinogen decarboxylase
MVVNNHYFSFQEGVHRMEAAMSGIPDRVPVCAQIHELVMKELGIDATTFYTQPDYLPAGTLEILQKYGIDVPFLDYDAYNIEAEAIGQELIFSDHTMPEIDRSRPMVRDRNDLKKIKTPDFENQGRFAVVIEMIKQFHELTGVATALNFTAPFTLASNIRGIEQLLLDIYLDPDFTKELFVRITDDLLVPWILYLKDTFPDVKDICCNDAAGSLPIFSPDILKEWIVPYVLRLRELCGSEIYLPNWVGEQCMRNPEEMFDLKLQVCPRFLEGQDPDVASLGPEIYKRYALKHDVSLILGIGAGFLALSTPGQIAERVKYYIRVGGENGRFALYLCNLAANTPPENITAAIETVHRYGSYDM